MLALSGIAAGIAVVGHGVMWGESASAAVPAANGYIYPTDPFKASTEAAGQFNAYRTPERRHMGLDTWAYRGAPILAIAAGRITGGDWNSTSGDPHGWGHFVTVDHGNGVQSRYAHFNGAPIVQLNANVRQGQVLGYMGNSQNGPQKASMGVHLHFEVIVNGTYVSPLLFLKGNATPPPASNHRNPSEEPLLILIADGASSDGVVRAGQAYADTFSAPLTLLTGSETQGLDYWAANGVPYRRAVWPGNTIRELIKVRGVRPWDPNTGKSNYSAVNY